MFIVRVLHLLPPFHLLAHLHFLPHLRLLPDLAYSAPKSLYPQVYFVRQRSTPAHFGVVKPRIHNPEYSYEASSIAPIATKMYAVLTIGAGPLTIKHKISILAKT